jgi:hypothetical protein
MWTRGGGRAATRRVVVMVAYVLTVAGCAAGTSAPQPDATAGGSIRAGGPSVTAATSASATSGVDMAFAPTTAVAPTAQAQPIGPPPATGPVLAASAPVSLRIPAIGVDSTLIELGLNPDSTVEVPPLDDPVSPAGWYTGSPEPGTAGPSIILGHIDSRAYGPGVFYRLGELRPADVVEIARADGSVATFRVDGVETFDKNAFPTLQVYGNIDHAGLRLITCGGVFDATTRNYESNIVAFASLVAP